MTARSDRAGSSPRSRLRSRSRRDRRALIVVALAVGLGITTSGGISGRTSLANAAPQSRVPGRAPVVVRPADLDGSRPRIDHIVVVVLENQTAEAVLETKRAEAPFLNGLAKRGIQLDAMFGVDHHSLPNYLAMVSGHASTKKTRADCFVFSCVYSPGQDETVADQLEAKGLTWKAYIDGMATPCQHSVEHHIERYRSGYAARHNPFLYFASIVRNDERCAAHDVPLADLVQDTTASRLPTFSFIVPDTCHDGHDCPLATADAWVNQTIGPILDRPEIRDHGLVVVTFDEADSSDVRGCCGNSRGGRIATWVLGAGVAVGGQSATPYNHYSLLRTIEDTFGLPCLRHACDQQTAAFGPEIWGGVAAPVVATPALTSLPNRLPLLGGVTVLALTAVSALFWHHRRERRRRLAGA